MKPGKTVALAMAALMVFQLAGAQELPPEVRRPPRVLAYAAEFGAGLGGTVLGLALGIGLFYCGAAVSVIGLAIAFAGGGPFGLLLLVPGAALMGAGFTTALCSPACGAYAVSAVGSGWREGGTLNGAAVGAYVGLIPGAGIGYVGYCLTGAWNTWANVPFYAVGAACVAAGATIGYNLSIPKTSAVGGLGERLQPPGITFTSVEHLDHSVEYGVKVQLVTIRL